MPVALVTGAAGQDGSYLAERLLADGYAVHALVRPGTPIPVERPRGAATESTYHEVDLTDHARLGGLVDAIEPDEIYNLAGVSSVAQSWTAPVLTAEVSGVAAVVLLDQALKLQRRLGRPVRVVQAGSAEIFGQPSTAPQDEATPLRPLSPYGVAKAMAHQSVGVFRSQGLFAVSAILYNHESPRRPVTFVTRKITRAVATIAETGTGHLTLGNLAAARDWGWAPDYVDALIRAARHTDAGDYIVATGQAHSVEDFVQEAFAHVGIRDWQEHVTIDPALFRPADPAVLVGDASRARTILGWRPDVDFAGIVARMVDHDRALLRHP